MFKCPSCLNSLNLSVVSQVGCFMTISLTYKCSVKQPIICGGSQMPKVSPVIQFSIFHKLDTSSLNICFILIYSRNADDWLKTATVHVQIMFCIIHWILGKRYLMSRKWIQFGWFGKANVLRRATLCRLGPSLCPGSGPVLQEVGFPRLDWPQQPEQAKAHVLSFF